MRFGKKLLAERKSPARRFARKLEALLGLDPDENPKLLEVLRKHWEPKTGKEALGEIAAASSPTEVEMTLKETSKAISTARSFADISSLESIRPGIQQSWTDGPQVPWLLARDAAAKVRKVWGLGSKPLMTSVMAELLQVSETVLNHYNPDLPFAVGVRGQNEKKLSFVLNRRNPQSRRFDVARVIGDQVGFEFDEKWRPVTNGMTVRQKFQRAFAAELLCPSDEVLRRYSVPLERDAIDDAVSETAHEYDVSERLVLSHLVNRGLAPDFLLESEPFFSWLEAAHIPNCVP